MYLVTEEILVNNTLNVAPVCITNNEILIKHLKSTNLALCFKTKEKVTHKSYHMQLEERQTIYELQQKIIERYD